jgi:nucleotide-binding universal stress UspA family protein
MREASRRTIAAAEEERAMSYKDLVVHGEATPQGLARLTLAANVAAAHQAYLTGLFLKPPPVPPPPLFVALGGYAGVPDPDQWSRQHAEAVAKDLHSCEAAFRRELARARVEGEWHVAEASRPDVVFRRAEYADLVIIGQAKGTAEKAMDFPAEIALSCGRPILVVPEAGKFEAVGKRILIAWKDGRESIRAVNDALPFLERAGFVALFTVIPNEGGGRAGTEVLDGIAQHLARHGVKAERYVMTAPDKNAGEALLSRAADFDCDLIVMGAYGHARLREIVFGGATHTVLGSMNMPVLMSH